MSYCHNSCVINIFLKHWKNHYLEIVKMHSGPETRPGSLFERSGDRIRIVSGSGQNGDRIGIGIGLGQDQDQAGVESG